MVTQLKEIMSVRNEISWQKIISPGKIEKQLQFGKNCSGK